jgi:hypothetical protein
MSETTKTNATAEARPFLRRGPGLHDHEIGGHRREYWFDNAPPGTTQHDVMHPEFWRHYKDGLMRNDVLHILVEGEGGEPERWEILLTVEAVAPDFVVSQRARFSRKPLSVDIVRLPDGSYIQRYAGADGRHKAFTVFTADHKATPITGHLTSREAQREWERRRPKVA